MTGKLTRTAGWLNAQSKTHLPALLFLTDDVRTLDPLSAIASLPRNAGVIFRHYDDPDRNALAQHCRALCRAQKRYFALASDWRLALRLRADGIHLPERLAHLLPRLQKLAPQLTTTTAVHDLKSLKCAERFGADAVFASPVFATASHPNARALGPITLAAWAHQTSTPIYALGGIDEISVHRLKETGASGIAAIGALLKKD